VLKKKIDPLRFAQTIRMTQSVGIEPCSVKTFGRYCLRFAEIEELFRSGVDYLEIVDEQHSSFEAN